MKLLVLAMASLLLVGCKVKTPDGSIPDEHIDKVKPHLGTYVGTFGKTLNGELTLSLNRNKPVLNFSSELGLDILGAGCEAEIGQLESFSANRRRAKLKYANFDLKHNCRVGSDQLTVVPLKNGDLRVEVLVNIRHEYVCRDRHLSVPIEAPTMMAAMTDFQIPEIPEIPDLDVCYDLYVGTFSKAK